MDLIASEVMHRSVKTVAASMTLPELDRCFVAAGVTGFPVLDGELVVGVVSRFDILRALDTERLAARQTSDFYRDSSGFHEIPLETMSQLAARVGERMEQMTVRDVMHHEVVSVAQDQTLRAIAEILVDRDIHRVLVLREGKLLGVISTSDFARLYAQGRIQAK